MERLNFEQFVHEVKDKIGDYLPEHYKDCNIDIKTVTKNNNLTLTGLLISIPGVRVTPNIYLEHFYDEYQKNGIDLTEVIMKIVNCRIKHEVSEQFDVEEFLDFKNCRDRIYPKIVSKLDNDYIKDKVFMPLASDLAVIYQIVLDKSDTGSATITITNPIMHRFGIHLLELDEIAIENMKRDNPSVFLPISQIIRELVGDEFAENMEQDLMYVLTNKTRVNGAAAVLDEDIMRQVCEKFDKFYILMTSINETIIVPVMDGVDPFELSQMVTQINATEVDVEDRLSDEIYIYDKKKKTIINFKF